ncbi:MAG: D-glycerate dehydrogenase [Actinobacteria bacterium]|jgi:glyoxylate reductase|nr:D-glycerate dehydrogenase [Actinomycetes bacterium]MCX6506727.1 D-glycerate dehydrogenase [Actinomycetota bacterium]
MAPVVFVTRPLPAPGIDLLVELGFEVRANDEDRPLQRAELIAGVEGADALLCMLSDRIDEEVLDAAPLLRVVSNYAVGFDNIDVAAARQRGIEVTTTPGVLTDATADLAWALLLSAARNLGAGERLVRAGEWTGWAPTQLLGEPLRHQTLGIVGMGAIGQAVARRAQGFGMNVVYFNRKQVSPEIETSLGAEFVSLDDLLRRSDFISLHAPLNDQSRHMFDARAFRLMKSTAVLVNTGRGALIDEAELVNVLRERQIAAAGLDVYEFEPKITEGLLTLDNVVLAPHLGSASTLARGDMVRLCCENIVEVLAGRPAVTPAPA